MIGQSTSIRAKKPADQKNILAYPNFFLFFLNVSISQADSKTVPNYGFQCKGRPIAGSKIRNRHFLRFFTF
jgi:hypothetical protein